MNSDPIQSLLYLDPISQTMRTYLYPERQTALYVSMTVSASIPFHTLKAYMFFVFQLFQKPMLTGKMDKKDVDAIFSNLNEYVVVFLH